MKISKLCVGGGVGHTQGYTQGGKFWQDTSHGHFSLFYFLPSCVAWCFISLCFFKIKRKRMTYPHEYIYIF